MSEPIRFRGRCVGPTELTFIQELVAANPKWSRRRLSAELCRAWNWVQPNGALRDMVCRTLLLRLHRSGLIELPAKKMSPPNNVTARSMPAPTLPLWEERRECSLRELGQLEIRQVRRTAEEPLFGRLMEGHHYLRYTQPVGEHLKYLVFAGTEPIAAMAWSSAPRHLAARDRFIGWPPPVRRRHLHLIAYNTRFLILPWVRVRYLASHLLSRVARQISEDWEKLYAHPIHFLETFIDPARFRGSCYRAANWTCLGLTSGRGHNDQTGRCNQPRKELWVYPLGEGFRSRLNPPQ